MTSIVRVLIYGILLSVASRDISAVPPDDDCPVGVPIVFCFNDPCKNSTCTANPDAQCRKNNCGSCKAEFVNSKGKHVECGNDNEVCPVDVKKMPCSPDPCKYAHCSANPMAVCSSRRCGKCEAEFYSNGAKVKCDQHAPGGAHARCPPGQPEVQCEKNLCEVIRCKKHPNATCKMSYCGVCKANFFNENGNLLNCSGSTEKLLSCPAKTIRVNCNTDPCKGVYCVAYPNANECRLNNCGGCKAEFKVDGKVVNCKGIKTALAPKISITKPRLGVKPKVKAKLFCTVSGEPKPEVTWYKDGKDIKCQSRCRVGQNRKKHKLVIIRVTARDAGKYTCKAVNVAGEDSKDITVFIK